MPDVAPTTTAVRNGEEKDDDALSKYFTRHAEAFRMTEDTDGMVYYPTLYKSRKRIMRESRIKSQLSNGHLHFWPEFLTNPVQLSLQKTLLPLKVLFEVLFFLIVIDSATFHKQIRFRGSR